MDVITYRLLKTAKDLTEEIDSVLAHNVYLNDTHDCIKTELRNEFIALHEYIVNHLRYKTSAIGFHSQLSMFRLRTSHLLDEICDMYVVNDTTDNYITGHIYNSIIILRELVYAIMSQLAINEF